MKLKYYLRGMGIGIILTAIVMGFALGGRKATISDAEVIERAKALGMVDGGVLSQSSEAEQENKTSSSFNSETTVESEEITDDSSASITSLDKEGEEISEEINQGVAGASKPLSEVAKDEKKESSKESEKEKTETESTKEISSAFENSGTDQKNNSSKTSVNSDTTVESSNNATAGTSHEKNEETVSAAAELTTSTQTETSSVLGSTTSTTKTVTIPGGLGSDQVAQILYKEGVIDNAASFNTYLIERKMDRIIRSGVKTIPAGSSYEDIARIICKG